MQQDLKEVFKKDRETQKYELKAGHEERFLKRLATVSPSPKRAPLPWLKIAAIFFIFLGAGYFFIQYRVQPDTTTTILVDKDGIDNPTEISLGDLSPDLKKVENYYLSNINLELSKLTLSQDNKELVSSYMKQLKDLNNEYLKLNTELNEIGPNDQTISAQIQNLQLRLQLLQKLKKKLNNLNTSKNEHVETSTI